MESSSFASGLQDSDLQVHWGMTERDKGLEHMVYEKMLRDVGLVWSTPVCKYEDGNYEGDRVKLFLAMVYVT